MLVLGIESTCDETACAIVREGKEILSNVISSQIDLHLEFGGVVPELACRRHIDVILPVLDEALSIAKVNLKDIDLIAVAHGPGLIGALLIGLNAAKALSLAIGKPFIGVNHIEAHLYAAIMHQDDQILFPSLGVIVSGGHTSLVKVDAIGSYQLIGQTVDDAVGEAFDKVAKIMGLPYPGGPQIEALALRGNPHKFPLKPGKVKGRPFDFSLSGLKTGVLYTIKGQNGTAERQLSEQEKCDLAASFQHTALNDVVEKALAAAKYHGCQSLIFGGGVTNNKRLRQMIAEQAPKTPVYWPSSGLSLDNAAMIAGLGYHRYRQRGHGDSLDLEAATRMNFN